MKLIKIPTCFLIFGPQASGKGSQGELIKNALNLSMISAGNLLKAARERTDSLGQTIRSYYDQGQLVPNDIVVNLTEESLKKTADSDGVIFDGFPRKIDQIASFENMIKFYNFKNIVVIYLNVKRETVMKRIAGRKVCSKCSRPYLAKDEAYQKGICDSCGGDLITRTDDTKEAIEKRLDIYYKETEPMIEVFKAKNELLEIDGEPSKDVVFQEIIDKLLEKGIIRP